MVVVAALFVFMIVVGDAFVAPVVVVYVVCVVVNWNWFGYDGCCLLFRVHLLLQWLALLGMLLMRWSCSCGCWCVLDVREVVDSATSLVIHLLLLLLLLLLLFSPSLSSSVLWSFVCYGCFGRC